MRKAAVKWMRVAGMVFPLIILPPVADTLPTGQPAPGLKFLETSGYVQYTKGDLPLIIGVPHGGTLEPAEIPDRISVTGGRYDTNSLELATAILKSFRLRTGKVPYLIVNLVHRKKLDTNRDVFEAAQDDSAAVKVWEEFHGLIDQAKETVAREFGGGLYIDLHGHRHPHGHLELGYLLVKNQLALPDDSLDAVEHVRQSSVRAIVESGSMSLAEVVRGASSLGSLFDRRGYRTVPSLGIPCPGGAGYFSGGYNTERHGSRDGGTISAIQLEAPWDGIRDTPESWQAFGDVSVDVLLQFLAIHFNYRRS